MLFFRRSTPEPSGPPPVFDVLRRLLAEKHPGRFACQLGKQGHANGLLIRCTGREGYAFLHEPNQNHRGLLLALREGGDDQNPEVWSAADAEEVVRRIEAWALPPQWTPPSPIDAAQERKRLQKIVAGLAARASVTCRRTEPKPEYVNLLTPQSRQEFDRDVAAALPERMVRHFPWDAGGRLALKTAVLLRAYETTSPPAHGRDLCLAALGPARRSDAVVRLELTDLIVANQAHRWDDCPWLWTASDTPADELLGTEAHGASPENQRAVASLTLLDAGKIEEALALYGVNFSDDLHRLLGGERISPPACCAHPDAVWTNLLIDTLRRSAPWRLPRAVASEAERLQRWAAEKNGRRRRPPTLKLAIFPGQHHARKASLILTGDVDGGHPRLTIEPTASNARPPNTVWQRPLEVDLARYGVTGDGG